MIKINKISNCHIWDGSELTKKDFDYLLILLQFSNHVHTVSYYEDGSDLKVVFIGGK